MEKWTKKEVFKGKMLWVLLLTVFLTFLLSKLINRILTREFTHDNGIIYTTHFELSLPAMLILAIPVSFLSAFLIQLILNKSGKKVQ